MKLSPVTVYLGLGSNLGDREANLVMALDLLSQRLRIKKVSSVYQTDPLGNVEQPRFLNQVCEAETNLSPQELLMLAKGIERKLGRRLTRPNAPRPMDIDILLYGDKVIDTPELVVPHPRLVERAFVLIPLAEIAPGLKHPVTGVTVKKLREELKEKQGVFRWEDSE